MLCCWEERLLLLLLRTLKQQKPVGLREIPCGRQQQLKGKQQHCTRICRTR